MVSNKIKNGLDFQSKSLTFKTPLKCILTLATVLSLKHITTKIPENTVPEEKSDA